MAVGSSGRKEDPLSEIRIIHPKQGAIKVRVDGKEIRLPPPGHDTVIQLTGAKWGIRLEQSVEDQEI